MMHFVTRFLGAVEQGEKRRKGERKKRKTVSRVLQRRVRRRTPKGKLHLWYCERPKVPNCPLDIDFLSWDASKNDKRVTVAEKKNRGTARVSKKPGRGDRHDRKPPQRGVFNDLNMAMNRRMQKVGM